MSLKYLNTQIVFQEIPDEVSLAINITQCPNNCKGCHSEYLKEDIGTELTKTELAKLIEQNEGISCILFMGGDKDRPFLNYLAKFIKNEYDLKVGYYSGLNHLDHLDLNNFDYIKIGPYVEELGGLSNPNTNQKLFEVNRLNKLFNKFNLTDITYKFWKNGNS